MIVVKMAESDPFYEAHFFIRPERCETELDMVAEAEKIASSMVPSKATRKNWVNKYLICGICGASLGAICMGIVSAIIEKGI